MSNPTNDRQSLSLDPSHPWHGFSHPDHTTEDLNRLLRLLRSILTDTQVLKLETQMMPFFRQPRKGATLQELRQTFEWLATNTHWKDLVRHPELIGLLADPASRRMLREFARNVVCAQALAQKVRSELPLMTLQEAELQRVSELLAEARTLGSQLKLVSISPRDLDQRIQEVEQRKRRLMGVGEFFQKISGLTGAPLATNSQQAQKLFRAVDALERIPPAVLPWRRPPILAPSSRLGLQTWKVKARPILELRKKLETHFKFNTEIAPQELWKLSEALKQEGFFAHFRSSYSQALRAYREMLRDKAARKIDSRESDFQRSERLLEWISFLDQSQAFGQNEEAADAFAPDFKGIDTDFSGAIEANTWSQKVREEILSPVDPIGGESDDSAFDSDLIEFVRSIENERIPVVIELCRSERALEILELMRQARFTGDYPFAESGRRFDARLQDLRGLRAICDALGFTQERPLESLAGLGETVEEILFLVRAMNSQQELRASLKAFFQGALTDLEAIEAASSYVKHVRAAALPTPIETLLLSAIGPQALADSSQPLSRCLAALHSISASFARLESATHGMARDLAHGRALDTLPLEEMSERVQNALRLPQLFVDAVAQLRQRRAAIASESAAGLTVDAAPAAPATEQKSI